MKNSYIIFLFAITLISCKGESGGLQKTIDKAIKSNKIETLREARTQVVSKQQEIAEQLKQLDEIITKLDTVKHIPLVTTFKAKTQEFKHQLEVQGSVTTKQLVTILPEYSGLLKEVYVKEGQQVTKGQTLARIDDGGLAQQLAQLQVQLNLAKTTFERQKRLWEQNIGSEIQYLQTKSSYEAQQEAINQLNQQLAKTVVTAPFTGTLDDVITDQGNVVAAGQSPLFRLVNLSNMYIEANIPESNLPNIETGKEVVAIFPVLGDSIVTTVRQVSNYINPSNRTFKVEIEVPNTGKKIKPNLTAKLKINDYTNKEAILIPQSIISENANGEQYVYVVDSIANGIGITKKVIIKTGKSQSSFVEVLKGIGNGNQIINEGARSVLEGQQVEIIED